MTTRASARPAELDLPFVVEVVDLEGEPGGEARSEPGGETGDETGGAHGPREGGVRLRVSGDLTLDAADALRIAVLDRIPDGAERADLDLSEVRKVEGAGVAQLLALRAEIRERGTTCDLVGAGHELHQLLVMYGCPNDVACLKQAPTRIGMLDHLGRATIEFVRTGAGILDFLGKMLVSVGAAIRRPRTVDWRAIPSLMERTGADAVGIVLLINFLVGLIIALQSAGQLERFGANVFVSDLVGLSVLRELAPLMTAIVVAGRTGAAYAAELGTMRVNEEIDALHAMRLDPLRHLVIPRVVALAIVVPALSALGALLGLAGGWMIATYSLDLGTETYVNRVRDAVDASDILSGLIKSFAFAVAIALVACQRGLATRGGAEGVGKATTSAVVTILLLLVVLDALFTAGFNAFGL